MTTPHNPMEGRRRTESAHDAEAARRFGTTGDYWLRFEQDTDDGTTAEVLHLHHVLNDALPAGAPPPRFPKEWAWVAYAVWPRGESGAPGVYEWVAADDGWFVHGQRYPTQRAAATAALVARSRRDQARPATSQP